MTCLFLACITPFALLDSYDVYSASRAQRAYSASRAQRAYSTSHVHGLYFRILAIVTSATLPLLKAGLAPALMINRSPALLNRATRLRLWINYVTARFCHCRIM